MSLQHIVRVFLPPNTDVQSMLVNKFTEIALEKALFVSPTPPYSRGVTPYLRDMLEGFVPAWLVSSDPTRDLACQIYDEAKKVAIFTGGKTAVALGGAPIYQQVLASFIRSYAVPPVRFLVSVTASYVPNIQWRASKHFFGGPMSVFITQTLPTSAGVSTSRAAPGTVVINWILKGAVRNLNFLQDSVNVSITVVPYSQSGEIKKRVEDDLHDFMNKHALMLVSAETKIGTLGLEKWLQTDGFRSTAIHGDNVQMVQIFVKSITGKTITVELKTTDTVAQLKKFIEEKLGIPHYEQRLDFSAKQLNNDLATIDKYNIKASSTLHLCLRLRGGMQIRVRDMALGREMMLEVNEENLCFYLKCQIEKIHGIPTAKQSLWYENALLSNENSLAHYNIKRGGTVELIDLNGSLRFILGIVAFVWAVVVAIMSMGGFSYHLKAKLSVLQVCAVFSSIVVACCFLMSLLRLKVELPGQIFEKYGRLGAAILMLLVTSFVGVFKETEDILKAVFYEGSIAACFLCITRAMNITSDFGVTNYLLRLPCNTIILGVFVKSTSILSAVLVVIFAVVLTILHEAMLGLRDEENDLKRANQEEAKDEEKDKEIARLLEEKNDVIEKLEEQINSLTARKEDLERILRSNQPNHQ